jgi:hypothetical protein
VVPLQYVPVAQVQVDDVQISPRLVLQVALDEHVTPELDLAIHAPPVEL